MSTESLAAALMVRPVAAVDPELISADDIAALLRVSRRTVFRLRQRGDLPPPVEVSRNIVRWRLSDLRAYLDRLAVRKPRREK
jgi:predicted DNA-binding transcriptional regulator AlpA